MITSEVAFSRIAQSLDAHLRPAGFLQSEPVYHPEAFGSQFVVFEGGIASIRLIWDGKDGWFVLESALRSNKSKPDSWTTLGWQPFDFKNADDDQVSELCRSFEDVVKLYLKVLP